MNHYPDGFSSKIGGYIRLLRALYGLKQSPYLWQKHFSAYFKSFGLTAVPGMECLFTRGPLIVFFFVDDIIASCHPDHIHYEFEAALAVEYDIKRLGEPQYFLGIRLIRDRENRSIFQVQDAYIDKIVKRFNLDTDCKPTWSPMTVRELLKHSGTVSAAQIFSYQQKIGSINFVATTTRLDIAKTVSILPEHLQNPSSEHIEAANQCLRYLYTTKFYGLRYSGNSSSSHAFVAASDASFADDRDTRHYLMATPSPFSMGSLIGPQRSRELLPHPPLKLNCYPYQ